MALRLPFLCVALLEVCPRLHALDLVSVATRGNPEGVTLTFSAPVDPNTATHPANYSIAPGVTVNSVSLIEAAKVRLHTSTIAEGRLYTITINGVQDTLLPPGSLPTGTLRSFLQTQGGITRREFHDISGGRLADLTNHAKFIGNRPDLTVFTPALESPVDARENYGVQFLGYVTAPVTGDYTFYINSDDQGALFLSTDDTPANRVQIANEPQWNGSRSWVSGGNASSRYPSPSDAFLSDTLFIEAEDFDFGGGQSVTDVATGVSGPYAGGAYAGRGTAADADVDWHDGDAANQGGAYRQATGVDVGPQSSAQDRSRGSFSVQENFAVGWNNSGDWYNYTREYPLPAKDYHVFARMSSGGGELAAQLDEVTSGLGTTTQTTAKLGQFHAKPSGNYIFMPLRDDAGNLARVSLAGMRTLRFTVLPGSLDVDYFILKPADSPTPDLSFLSPSNVSAPIHLEAGHRYFVEALMKEAGGGDNLAVAWRKPGDPEIANGAEPIPGRFLSGLDPLTPAAIAKQPQDKTVNEHSTVTFSIELEGTPPYDFQWYRNGGMLVGENAATLKLSAVPATLSGSAFHVVCGNGLNSLRSDDATLTVIADLTPPQLVFAEGRASLDEVGVGFSEPIDAADAVDLNRYQLGGGLTVLGAKLWGNQRLVILKTSPQTPGQSYTVTVNGIHDRATSRNAIASNSKLPFTGFDASLAVAPLPPGYQRITVTTRTGPVTVVIPRREFHFEPAGRTYYLATTGDDSNPGALDQPWRTFAHAVPLLRPGDCLYVREGDYQEPFVVRESGLPGRPIIVSAFPGESVLIRPPQDWDTTNRPEGTSTVTLWRVRNVWIHGFSIEGYPIEYGPVPGPHHYHLSNGIMAPFGNSDSSGCQILNNVISKAQHCGIKGNFDGSLIEGNVVFDNGISAYDHGMYLPEEFGLGMVARGNATFRNAGYGFHLYQNPAKAHVYNNLSFENGYAGIVESGHDNVLAHNVSLRNQSIAGYTLAGYGDARNNAFLNDILFQNAPQQLGLHWALDADPRGNTVDYTILWPPDPTVPPWVGQNLLAADPLFEDEAANDLRLRAGSVGRGAATPVALLGSRSPSDMGLFPATAYWEPSLMAIADPTVTEGTELHVQPALAEPAPPGTRLVYRLGPPLAPVGMAVDPDTGRLTWTPAEDQGPGEYPVSIIVEAEGSPAVSDIAYFRVRVTEANRSPVLGVGSPVIRTTFDDHRDFGYRADPWKCCEYSTFFDAPADPLAVGSTSIEPDGSIVMRAGGNWPATSLQYAYSEVSGDFDLRVRVTDLVPIQLNSRAGIVVREGLDPEVPFVGLFVTAPAPLGSGEYHFLYRSGHGQDMTGGPGYGTPGVVFPNAWIRLQRKGGSFRAFRSADGIAWIGLGELSLPGFARPVLAGLGANAYENTERFITARFADYSLEGSFPTDFAPESVAEGVELHLTAQGTDPDRPAQNLAYSLVDPPPGAAMDPTTGVFTWTPPESAGGQSFPITVRVTDNGEPPGFSEQTFTVAVHERNSPPVLRVDGDTNASAGKPMSFTVAASDPDDVPSNHVSLKVGDLPSGATFDVATGVFAWTPTREQGGLHLILLTATDDGVPALSAGLTVSIPVQVNNPPLLASIPNRTLVEGDTLRLELGTPDVGNTPGILREVFDGINGLRVADLTNSTRFRGAPSSSAIRTTFEAPREVGDNYGQRMRGFVIPPESGDYIFWIASDDASVLSLSTDALPTNARPIAWVSEWTDYRQWTKEANQRSSAIRLDAGKPYYIDALMKEGGGGDHLSVRWQLPNGAMETPIPRARLLAWTQEPVVFARDTDIPRQQLTFSLGPDAPSGSVMDPITGVLVWTASEGQAPGNYPITVRVTDNGEPPETSERTFTVTVAEVNAQPVLAAIGAKSANEGTALSFTVSTGDPNDTPPNAVTLSVTGLPDGASFNPATGAFVWTPGEQQQGQHQVTFTATDNGVPPLSVSEIVTITVAEQNTAPVLEAIGDRKVEAGQKLEFTVKAADADEPANAIRYALGEGAPVGAVIDAVSGLFQWTPDPGSPSGIHRVTVRATDDGEPAKSDIREFAVEVTEVVRTIELTGLSLSADGTVSFRWAAQVGKKYRVQVREELGRGEWQSLLSPVVIEGGVATFNETISSLGNRFYRVVIE